MNHRAGRILARAVALLLTTAPGVLATVEAAWCQERPGTGPRSGTAPDKKAGAERKQPVSVDADKMERFGKENLVVFTGNVIARQEGSVQYADRMEVYLDEKDNRVLRTVSRGNVRIVTRDCKTGTAQRAEYYELTKLMKLIGDARVWEEDNTVSGETIDIYLAEERSVVQSGKGNRVKAQFFPKDEEKDKAKAKPALPCPS